MMKLIEIFETPTPSSVRKQTLEIIVEPSGEGAFRATIRSVNGKLYGTNPTHPKEFIGSGATTGAALIDLGRKLKM